MSKRKTEEDYHKLAEKRGFKWVGEVLPKNTKTKTWWECKRGHRWQAIYNTVQQGRGCPYCFNHIKKTEKDYYNLAKSREFKWVGGVLPKDTMTKTQFECRNGHKWQTTYSKVQQGAGCPYCSNKFTRIEDDYHRLAESCGFKWVGKRLPKTTQYKTWWECKKGHKWKARYSDIYNGGSGCPYCYGTAKKMKNDYYNLAKNRGFKWVGEVLPKNTKTKTWWECKRGHRWKTTYSIIQQGSNCPICENKVNGELVSKPQIKLNNMLTGNLNYPESRYHIDVAIMRRSQKIAIEYDCWYWHQGKEKQETKRDKFLIEHGWKVLHVKADEMLPTRKQINIVIKHLLETNDSTCNLYLKDWKY